MTDYITTLLCNPSQIVMMRIRKMRESNDWKVRTITEHTLPWYKRIFNRHKGDVEVLYIVEWSYVRYCPSFYKTERFNKVFEEEYYFDGEKVYDRPRIRLWLSNGEKYTKYFKGDEEMSEWIGERQLLSDFIKNNMEILDYE